jgi:hypothetical protein
LISQLQPPVTSAEELAGPAPVGFLAEETTTTLLLLLLAASTTATAGVLAMQQHATSLGANTKGDTGDCSSIAK